MTPRSAAYVVFPAATLSGVLLAWFLARDGSRAPGSAGGDREGPRRCAALETDAPSREHILELETAGEAVVLGVVADARGARPRTLERLQEARRAFREAKVDLVLSLGGMGGDAAELASVYRTLAEDAPWEVVAIPGDREPVAAHREAVAAVAGAHPLRDGSAVRLIVTGAATVATFPGVAEPSQLVAGPAGCVYEAADADALARWLEPREGALVWASYAPPRQRGQNASDRARGVHIGDPQLSRAVRASGASLALHGLVDEAALRPREGVRRIGSGGFLGLAPGPAQALPVFGELGGVASGAALIVRIRPPRIEWERVDLARESDLRGSAAAAGTSK